MSKNGPKFVVDEFIVNLVELSHFGFVLLNQVPIRHVCALQSVLLTRLWVLL